MYSIICPNPKTAQLCKKHNPSFLGIYIYIYIDIYMKPTAYHIMVQPLQAHCHGKYDNGDKGW